MNYLWFSAFFAILHCKSGVNIATCEFLALKEYERIIMAQPWKTLDRVSTPNGDLELRQRGPRDFLITLGGLVLMNSLNNRSEVALGQLGCQFLKNYPAPRVLVGGLGMGCTLRAVLDSLSAGAKVSVAELNPVVVKWCRGPLAALTAAAVSDPRVQINIGDVALLVESLATGAAETFDAVIYDLYKGPHPKTDELNDPLYGSRAIRQIHRILAPGGLLTVWGENYDQDFENRLNAGGFKARTQRSAGGGYRHGIFIARKTKT